RRSSDLDVRTSGAIADGPGLVNVSGTLTVLDGATFVVAAENNGDSTKVALYARGAITISNPRKVLIYNGNTSASAAAVSFTDSVNFFFTGKNITTWAEAPAATVSTLSVGYDTPTARFENGNQAPYTVKGKANGANGKLNNVLTSGYSGSQAIDDNIFAGREVVGCLDFQPYTITYKIVNPDTGEESSAEGAFPSQYPSVQAGRALVGTTVPYYAERVGNYYRVPGQDIGLLMGEGVNEAVVYYRSGAGVASNAGLSKTAQRFSAHAWDVTLKIDSEMEMSATDMDIMLLLDASSSVTQSQKNKITTAAEKMMNTLAGGANLKGTIRVGVIFFSTTAQTRFESRLIQIRVGGAVQEDNLAKILAVLQIYRTEGDIGGTHMDVPVVAAHYELYHPTETADFYTPANPPTVYNPGSTKYMILLSDGVPAPSEHESRTIAAANAYKYHPGVHDDGKLITIGVRDSGVPFLDGLQNAGYYETRDRQIEEIFDDITDSIISTVRDGVVIDPVGDGLAFQATRNGTLPQATGTQTDVTNYLTVSQGRVWQQLVNNVPTLKWELGGPVQGTAALTYRVGLKDPTASINQLIETNGVTSLAYNNADNQDKEAFFDVPRVMYQQSSLKLVYTGIPQPYETPLGVWDMYPTMPDPYQFDGPPESKDGCSLTSVTLRGSEGVGEDGNIQIKDWDVTAATMAELIAATNGRITDVGGGRYSMAAPASNDMRLIFTYTPPENLTVTYHWNLPVYQGQTAQVAPGSAALPALATYPRNTNVTLASGSGLKLLGYNFKGWALSQNATAANCITRIDGIQENTDVYAIWQNNPVDPPTTVTVTYHAGNATGGTPPTDSGSPYLINENVTIIGNIGTPPLYRVGYEFEGWSGTSGGALQYAVGSQIQGIQTGLDLYPTWTSTGRVKVTYNENLPADGRKMNGAVPGVTEVEKYADVTLPGNTGGLVVTGYDFAGWAQSPTAAAPEEKILKIAADTTVYAVWTAATPVTVIYHRGSAEPGIGAPPEDEKSPYPKHSTVTVLGNVGARGLGGLVKYGYEFMGWSFTEGGSVVNALSNTDLYDVVGDENSQLHLYPVFGDFINFGLKYYRNDPEPGAYKSGEAPTDDGRYNRHVTVQLAGNDGNLVMLGYDFVGWARSANAGESAVITQIVDITQDENLYAVWRKDPKSGGYSVTYKMGAATGGTAPTDANSPYKKHADVTILGNTGNLTLAGKEFAGWATTANATGPEFVPGNQVSGVLRDIQADVDMYPVFSADVTWVTVTYDLNLPSGAERKSGAVPDPTSHLIHTTADLAAPAADLVVLGYDFGGWTLREGVSPTTQAITQIANITKDTTVYAIWNGIPGTGDPGDPAHPQQPITYTVDYRRGDATGGDPPAGGTYRKHETVTVSANTGIAPNFEPLYQIGRDVAGWARTQGGTIALKADGSGRIADISENYTLYPTWSEGPPLYQYVVYKENVPGDGVLVGGKVPEGDLYTKFLKHGEAQLAGNAGGLLVLGYDFAGWALSATAGVNDVITKIGKLSETTEVYAVWTAAPDVTVTYHRGSAEAGIGAPPAGGTYPKHSTVMIVGNTGGLTKYGYNFMGWTFTEGSG
ncbi:MAG: VWA domain-containing protein, partial [Oscillospiraceae bacterium]|nr:VWA domain-containing protein [Oscillospiraceae bacterium]